MAHGDKDIGETVHEYTSDNENFTVLPRRYTRPAQKNHESNHHFALDNRLRENVTGDFKHPKATPGSMAP